MSFQGRCCLCSQIAGDASNDLFFRLMNDSEYVRRVPFESGHFAAVPSLGPLTLGHTLLCPKDHLKSFACVPARLDEEYDHFKRRLRDLLTQVFKFPVHFFEHGMSKVGNRMLCTVDHAHLHLVPADISLLDRIGSYGVSLHPIENTLECLREEVGGGEYLFYEAPNGESFLLIPRGVSVESQFLRKVFAEAVGRRINWNWRETPLPIEADHCFRLLSAEVQGFVDGPVRL